jgi:2-hydroxy-6-oxonona-2,4-dienedioate hydrolase
MGMLVSVNSLAEFVDELLIHLKIEDAHIVGNSLGGHIALIHTINNPNKIKSITLVGSSGLFENGMGDTFPKRGNYEYIKHKAELTFLQPHHASKELVDEIFETVNNRIKVLQILSLARSTIKHNLSSEIKRIQCPTLIVWGKQDIVTPPIVAEQFHKSIIGSKLIWIDQCGHVPMIETPDEFNQIYNEYISAF